MLLPEARGSSENTCSSASSQSPSVFQSIQALSALLVDAVTTAVDLPMTRLEKTTPSSSSEQRKSSPVAPASGPPVEFPVDEPTQVDIGDDRVAGAVAEQQRRVSRIGRVAEVRVTGTFVRAARNDEGQDRRRTVFIPMRIGIGHRQPSEARVPPDRARSWKLELLLRRAPSERVLAGLAAGPLR